MAKNTFEKIYDVVRTIPYGQVASYGQVAALAGNRRWSRVVGYALNVCNPEELPCHRVVTKEGKTSPAFALNGVDRQRELLEAEGVEFLGDFVDMKKYQMETTWAY